MNPNWQRYQELLCVVDSLGISLDVSRMGFTNAWLDGMKSKLDGAFDAMEALEQGKIANPDEKRRVGHYWLRAPELASPEDAAAINDAVSKVKSFTADVHAGRIAPPSAPKFTRQLIIGIGGSALGPQLAADALGTEADRLQPYFFDNTDPDGFDRVLGRLSGHLKETMVVVISKSGGTKETRNGMLEAQVACSVRGSISASTRWRSPAQAVSSSGWRRVGSRGSRCGTGLAAARPKPRRSGSFPPRCKGSMSMRCSPARARWTRPPAFAMRSRTPRR